MARAKPGKPTTIPSASMGPRKPAFVAPCLATATREPPCGDLWVHEIKFDGYRIQAHLENQTVALYTRSGLNWSPRFKSVARALGQLAVSSCILDGEIVVEDDQGRSNFAMLVAELKAGRSARMSFYAFDLLYLNGHDTRGLTLGQRKDILARVLEGVEPRGGLRLSEHLACAGATMLAQSCKLGLEGIISKRIDKPYHSGRAEDWLKSKCLQSDEFVVGGYVPSKAMSGAVGALLLGCFEGGDLRYVGRVGTGFSQQRAGDLYARLQPLRRSTAPFKQSLTSQQLKDVCFVEPELVAQIEYRAITSDDLLRHASFKALRDDKSARDVVMPRFIDTSRKR